MEIFTVIGSRYVNDDFGRNFGLNVGLNLGLAIEGGETVEQQLAEIGKGYGVTTLDALESELPDEIAEEAIDVWSGVEAGDGAKKLGSNLVCGGFGVRFMDLAELGVHGREHSAVASLGTEVLAGGLGPAFGFGGNYRVGTWVGGGPPINFVRM